MIRILFLLTIFLFTRTPYQQSNNVTKEVRNISMSSRSLSLALENVSDGGYTCIQNGLNGLEDFRKMQEYYYEASPNEFCGFATRYGSDTLAINELYWEARQVVEQFNHGYVMLGGNYGFQMINGTEYLLDNRASEGYGKHVYNQQPQQLNENQLRLYQLGKMNKEDFIHYVITNYVGVISIKSPNDIGREFCLYTTNDSTPVGTVIVGGTAASHDWLPIGYRANPETISLGLMLYKDSQNEVWSWSADLPNSLYYLLSYNNEHPRIKLVSGRCEFHDEVKVVAE